MNRATHLLRGARLYAAVLRGELPETRFGGWLAQARLTEAELALVSRLADNWHLTVE